MSTIRTGIVGVTGYTGEELLRLLLTHQNTQLTYLAASAKWERPTPLAHVVPRFAHQLDLAVEAFESARCIAQCDVVFLALPHGTAMEIVPPLLAAGKRVIDLSGDFRLHDPSLYPTWYKFAHTHPELLTPKATAYGLTEYFRPHIAKAALVANPGCYATSILLGVLPLLRASAIRDGRFIVDAKSGLSGAGRKADQALLYTEMTENLRPYKVNAHQHMPEVTQVIQEIAGSSTAFSFVPQVIPATRGLISMIYASVANAQTVASAFETAYPASTTPFVRLRGETLPQLTDVTQTNFCDIGWNYHAPTHTVVVASAIDNLVKGAAGQAVQNFNVMHGWPETMGLLP